MGIYSGLGNFRIVSIFYLEGLGLKVFVLCFGGKVIIFAIGFDNAFIV